MAERRKKAGIRKGTLKEERQETALTVLRGIASRNRPKSGGIVRSIYGMEREEKNATRNRGENQKGETGWTGYVKKTNISESKGNDCVMFFDIT